MHIFAYNLLNDAKIFVNFFFFVVLINLISLLRVIKGFYQNPSPLSLMSFMSMNALERKMYDKKRWRISCIYNSNAASIHKPKQLPIRKYVGKDYDLIFTGAYFFDCLIRCFETSQL